MARKRVEPVVAAFIVLVGALVVCIVLLLWPVKAPECPPERATERTVARTTPVERQHSDPAPVEKPRRVEPERPDDEPSKLPKTGGAIF